MRETNRCADSWSTDSVFEQLDRTGRMLLTPHNSIIAMDPFHLVIQDRGTDRVFGAWLSDTSS